MALPPADFDWVARPVARLPAMIFDRPATVAIWPAQIAIDCLHFCLPSRISNRSWWNCPLSIRRPPICPISLRRRSRPLPICSVASRHFSHWKIFLPTNRRISDHPNAGRLHDRRVWRRGCPTCVALRFAIPPARPWSPRGRRRFSTHRALRNPTPAMRKSDIRHWGAVPTPSAQPNSRSESPPSPARCRPSSEGISNRRCRKISPQAQKARRQQQSHRAGNINAQQHKCISPAGGVLRRDECLPNAKYRQRRQREVHHPHPRRMRAATTIEKPLPPRFAVRRRILFGRPSQIVIKGFATAVAVRFLCSLRLLLSEECLSTACSRFGLRLADRRGRIQPHCLQQSFAGGILGFIDQRAIPGQFIGTPPGQRDQTVVDDPPHRLRRRCVHS